MRYFDIFCVRCAKELAPAHSILHSRHIQVLTVHALVGTTEHTPRFGLLLHISLHFQLSREGALIRYFPSEAPSHLQGWLKPRRRKDSKALA